MVRVLLALFTLTLAASVSTAPIWAAQGDSGGDITADSTAGGSTTSVASEQPASSAVAPSDTPSTAPESVAPDTPDTPAASVEPAVPDTSSTTGGGTTQSTYIDPDNTVSGKSESVTSRPDTGESQVNQNASAVVSNTPNAAQQDWSNLMPSSTSSASSKSASLAAGGAGSVTSGQKGSFSSMFLLGIGLIVAAVCGVVAFIYLQFVSHKHRAESDAEAALPQDEDEYGDDGYAYTEGERTRMKPPVVQPASAQVLQRQMPETMTDDMKDTISDFTDINSSSDGIQHREEYEEFVERTRPPIVPKPASQTPPRVYTPPRPDKDTLVLPDLSSREAEQRARKAAAARVQAHHRQPPLTSNAVRRGQVAAAPLQSGETVRQTMAEKQPTVSAVPAAAEKVTVQEKTTASEKQDSSFDWDKFFNENRDE